MIRPLAVAALALAVLAGCASPPPPIDAGEDPTPTPTVPTQAAVPSFALGLGCADLVSLDAVQATMTDPIEVWRDESTAPSEANDVALTTAGGLGCVWGGTDGNNTDGSPDTGLVLRLLPGGQAVRDAFAAQGQPADWCDTTFPQCSTSRMLGDVWLEASYSDAGGGDDVEAGADGFASLVATISDVVTATTERSSWTADPAAFTGETACSDPAIASAALEIDADALVRVDRGVALGDEVLCRWRDGESGPYLDIAVVAGGAWGFDQLGTNTPEVPWIGATTPLSFEGIDGGFSGCGEHCGAYLNYGGSWVQLDADSDADIAGLAERFVAAL